MKFGFPVLIFILLSNSAFTQSIPKLPVKTTTAPVKKEKDKQPVKTPPPNVTNTTTAFHKVKFVSNLPGQLYIDGEMKGMLAVNVPLHVSLGKGSYSLKAVSSANSADQVNDSLHVVSTGDERFYQVDLQAVIEMRLQKEKEAKIAYLMAEEQFKAGKFNEAVQYLDLATEKLGNASAKTLYLKIMALLPLVKQDQKQLPRIKEAIQRFEKSSDLETLSEDKQVEIIKLKLQLENAGTLVVATNEDRSAIFAKYQPDGWMLGLTLEEAKSRKPDFFKNAIKTVSSDSTITYTNNPPYAQPQKYVTVIFKRDKISFVHISFVITNEDKNFSKAKQLVNSWISWFSGTPTINTNTDSNKTLQTTTTMYSWREENITASIISTEVKANAVLNYKVNASSVGASVSIN